jgi:DNA repair protein RecO (recombination protein O)
LDINNFSNNFQLVDIIYVGDGFLSTFKTKAIVLKTADLKENDKLVWLFTEKLGKISAVAKGAKKNRSKFLSLTLPFCFGEFVVFKGKSLYTINEGEVVNSFQSLLNDLDSLTYSSYLCELIDISQIEEESNRELFKELIKVFYLMENKALDLDLLCRAFEVKLLMASGYNFNLEQCVICRRKISTSNYVSLEYFGGICSDCEKERGMNVSFATFNALKYLVKVSIENVYRLTLTKDVKDEIYKFLANIIADNFGRRPNSLQMFEYIKGVD